MAPSAMLLGKLQPEKSSLLYNGRRERRKNYRVRVVTAQKWTVDEAATQNQISQAGTPRHNKQQRKYQPSPQTRGRKPQSWNPAFDPRKETSFMYSKSRRTTPVEAWGRQLPPRVQGSSRTSKGVQSPLGPVQAAIWEDRPASNVSAEATSSGSSSGTSSHRQSRETSGVQVVNRDQSPSATPELSKVVTGASEILGPHKNSSKIDIADSPELDYATSGTAERQSEELRQDVPASNGIQSTVADEQPEIGYRATPKPKSASRLTWWPKKEPQQQPAAKVSQGRGKTNEDDWAEEFSRVPESEDGWGPVPPRRTSSPNPSSSSSSFSYSEEFRSTLGNSYPIAGEPDTAAAEPEVLEDPEDPEDPDEWEEDESDLPDITLLPPAEVDQLLPIVPSTEQMAASWGTAVDGWQRLGASLFVTLVSAKLNLVLLASGAVTYPLWGPALEAANRNRALRKKGRFVGFWRTSVLEVAVERPQRRRYTGRTPSDLLVNRPSVRFLLGDASGARSQLTLAFNRRFEQIQVGEPAEVLVLSSQSGFRSFKALKEVYLPVSGIWLSEYPHVERNLFLDISLDIERERKEEMVEGAFDTSIPS